jgi:hypothetical protein
MEIGNTLKGGTLVVQYKLASIASIALEKEK